MIRYAFGVAVAALKIAAGFPEGDIQFVFAQSVVGIEVEDNIPALSVYGNHGFPVLPKSGLDNGYSLGPEIVRGDAGHGMTPD